MPRPTSPTREPASSTGSATRDPPESPARALLEILRVAVGTRESRGDPTAGVDGERLDRIARRHAVDALVSRWAGREGVDASGAYRANAERSLHHAGELHRLCAALRGADVRVLPYKGPVMAALAYDDPAARVFEDLDLLVHPADVGAAVDVLEGEGFAPAPGGATVARAIPRFGYECQFVRERDDVLVDLQWGVVRNAPAGALSVAALWERRESVGLGGREVATLSLEDHLLVATHHGAKHAWGYLVWVCDVAALLERYELDWAAVFGRAERSGVVRKLLVGLALARELLGAAVPDGVAERIEVDNRAQVLAGEIAERFLDEPLATVSEVDRVRFHGRALDSRVDAGRFLLRTAFEPTIRDYRAFGLGPAWYPVYVALRPLRLLRAV